MKGTKKKTRPSVGKTAPGHYAKEEDLLIQVEETPQPVPHPYTAANILNYRFIPNSLSYSVSRYHNLISYSYLPYISKNEPLVTMVVHFIARKC